MRQSRDEIDLNYEHRLVLYADIIGWRGASDSLKLEILLAAVNELKLAASSYNSAHRTRLLESEARGEIKVNPMILDVQFAMFSDNFVFSMPASFGARILTVATPLVLNLLHRGFLVRGGIAIGNIYHKDNVVFGPALNQAVQIEQEYAVFPRILVSESSAIHIREVTSDLINDPMINDHMGCLFANPFAISLDGPDEILIPALIQLFRPSEIDKVIDRNYAELLNLGQND